MSWAKTIKIKHLFTDDESWESVSAIGKSVAEVVQRELPGFGSNNFKKIPKGDHIMKPVDYFNKELTRLYDYADEHRIWID